MNYQKMLMTLTHSQVRAHFVFFTSSAYLYTLRFSCTVISEQFSVVSIIGLECLKWNAELKWDAETIPIFIGTA